MNKNILWSKEDAEDGFDVSNGMLPFCYCCNFYEASLDESLSISAPAALHITEEVTRGDFFVLFSTEIHGKTNNNGN